MCVSFWKCHRIHCVLYLWCDIFPPDSRLFLFYCNKIIRRHTGHVTKLKMISPSWNNTLMYSVFYFPYEWEMISFFPLFWWSWGRIRDVECQNHGLDCLVTTSHESVTLPVYGHWLEPVQEMTRKQKSQNEDCWTLWPNPTNTHSAKHQIWSEDVVDIDVSPVVLHS